MRNKEGVKAFGMHLRRLRDEKNLSQQELADLADMRKTSIQRIEWAQASPTLDTLLTLSQALEISLQDLMKYSVPKEKPIKTAKK
ncbi:MAG: helix-turn-helix transcriptional regulator [Bacteroidetes bacterium]|nr:helix-turn-helix transcriptional regulator [Bacteroidota bacterium]